MAERWSDEELQFLKDNYNNMSYAKMSERLNRHLPGLIAKCRRLKLVKDNKKRGGFKSGVSSNNKKLCKPGDVINIIRNGKNIPHVKLENGEWISLARKVWMDVNGPIPNGMCIYHKDNDTTNCEFDNLQMLKRGALKHKSKLPEFTIQEVTENIDILPAGNIKIRLFLSKDVSATMKASEVPNYLQSIQDLATGNAA